jgi:hypothetical protein
MQFILSQWDHVSRLRHSVVSLSECMMTPVQSKLRFAVCSLFLIFLNEIAPKVTCNSSLKHQFCSSSVTLLHNSDFTYIIRLVRILCSNIDINIINFVLKFLPTAPINLLHMPMHKLQTKPRFKLFNIYQSI